MRVGRAQVDVISARHMTPRKESGKASSPAPSPNDFNRRDEGMKSTGRRHPRPSYNPQQGCTGSREEYAGGEGVVMDDKRTVPGHGG